MLIFSLVRSFYSKIQIATMPAVIEALSGHYRPYTQPHTRALITLLTTRQNYSSIIYSSVRWRYFPSRTASKFMKDISYRVLSQ